jgi:hypothetical protein
VKDIPEAFEKDCKTFSRQTYEITNEVTTGETVALEVPWTGALAIPFGTLAAGSQMRCHSAMFLEFRDGKIVAQTRLRLLRTVVETTPVELLREPDTLQQIGVARVRSYIVQLRFDFEKDDPGAVFVRFFQKPKCIVLFSQDR